MPAPRTASSNGFWAALPSQLVVLVFENGKNEAEDKAANAGRARVVIREVILTPECFLDGYLNFSLEWRRFYEKNGAKRSVN